MNWPSFVPKWDRSRPPPTGRVRAKISRNSLVIKTLFSRTHSGYYDPSSAHPFRKVGLPAGSRLTEGLRRSRSISSKYVEVMR
jgi:hypothetical protein